MTDEYFELRRAFDSATDAAYRRSIRKAKLGDGNNNLRVSGRPGYVYARFGDASVGQVRCTKVMPVYGLDVNVRRGVDGIMEVVEIDHDLAMAFTDGRPANVGPHAAYHSRLGPDALYIEGLQFRPLLTRPATTPGLTVYIEAYAYRYNGFNKYFSGGEVDLTSYVPSTSGQHTFVIVSLDPATNTPVVTPGTTTTPFVPSTTSIPFTGSDVAGIQTGSLMRSAAVRLYYGQTVIRPIDIFMDLRGSAGGSGIDVTVLSRAVVSAGNIVTSNGEIVWVS